MTQALASSVRVLLAFDVYEGNAEPCHIHLEHCLTHSAVFPARQKAMCYSSMIIPVNMMLALLTYQLSMDHDGMLPNSVS